MLLGKINGATREDSSIFFLTNSNDTTSKFVIKVCNHLFTLNFYITEVSHVVQVRAKSFCPLPLLYPSASDFQFRYALVIVGSGRVGLTCET